MKNVERDTISPMKAVAHASNVWLAVTAPTNDP